MAEFDPSPKINFSTPVPPLVYSRPEIQALPRPGGGSMQTSFIGTLAGAFGIGQAPAFMSQYDFEMISGAELGERAATGAAGMAAYVGAPLAAFAMYPAQKAVGLGMQNLAFGGMWAGAGAAEAGLSGMARGIFGAGKIGTAMAGTAGGIGAIAGGAVGLAGGLMASFLPFMAVEQAAEWGMGQVTQQFGFQRLVKDVAPKFALPGVWEGPTGREMEEEMATFLREYAAKTPGMDPARAGGIFAAGAEMGFFDTAQSSQEVQRRIVDLAHTIRTIQENLHVGFQEATQISGQMRMTGFYQPQDIAAQIVTMNVQGKMAGYTAREMQQLAYTGAEMMRGTGIPLRVGAQMITQGVAGIRQLTARGIIGEETIAQLGGVTGAARAVTASRVRWMMSPMGTTMLAGMMTPPDQEAQTSGDMLNKFIQDQDIDALVGQAQTNLAQGGPEGMISFLLNRGKEWGRMSERDSGNLQLATLKGIVQQSGLPVTDDTLTWVAMQQMGMSQDTARIFIKQGDPEIQGRQMKEMMSMEYNKLQRSSGGLRGGMARGYAGVTGFFAREIATPYIVGPAVGAAAAFEREFIQPISRIWRGGTEELNVSVLTPARIQKAYAGVSDLSRGYMAELPRSFEYAHGIVRAETPEVEAEMMKDEVFLTRQGVVRDVFENNELLRKNMLHGDYWDMVDLLGRRTDLNVSERIVVMKNVAGREIPEIESGIDRGKEAKQRRKEDLDAKRELVLSMVPAARNKAKTVREFIENKEFSGIAPQVGAYFKAKLEADTPEEHGKAEEMLQKLGPKVRTAIQKFDTSDTGLKKMAARGFIRKLERATSTQTRTAVSQVTQIVQPALFKALETIDPKETDLIEAITEAARAAPEEVPEAYKTVRREAEEAGIDLGRKFPMIEAAVEIVGVEGATPERVRAFKKEYGIPDDEGTGKFRTWAKTSLDTITKIAKDPKGVVSSTMETLGGTEDRREDWQSELIATLQTLTKAIEGGNGGRRSVYPPVTD